eukprot:COSAG01_NODE_7105_length_3352_cov_3.350753_3_plen_95_part_00
MSLGRRPQPPEPGPTNWVEYQQLLASVTASVAGRAYVLEQKTHTLPGLFGCSTLELMPCVVACHAMILVALTPIPLRPACPPAGQLVRLILIVM